MSHLFWMNEALYMAKLAYKNNEVPVGAIVVKNNEIIGHGYNSSILLNDASAHAEIIAIRNAGKKIKNHRLINACIYVTLEPCSMCYGAITQARISKVFFGAYDFKTGVCGSCDNHTEKTYFNHRPELEGGILETECSEILSDFFKSKRN